MKYLNLLFLLFCVSLLSAQNNAKDYINRYKNIAIQQMVSTDIPASITLAQAILHTSVGTNTLAIQANNHFSLTCSESWDGEVLYRFKDNSPVCYKVFSSPAESFLEHTTWLANNTQFENLFYIEPTNYKRWARGLEAMGYSTASKYADQLVQIIELYELYELDKEKDTFSDAPLANTEANEVVYSSKDDVYYVNDLKAVVARNNETPLELAARMQIPLRKVLKYNDIDLVDGFYSGQYVYLEKKKSKFSGEKLTHKVETKDNIYLIAQTYGIRLSKLRRLNKLKEGEEPAIGQEIALQEKVKEKPVLRSPNFKPQPAVEEVIEEPTKPPVRIITPPISVKPDVPVLNNTNPNTTANNSNSNNTTVVENGNVTDKEIIYVYPDDPGYEGEVEIVGNNPTTANTQPAQPTTQPTTTRPGTIPRTSPRPPTKRIITNTSTAADEMPQNTTTAPTVTPATPVTVPANVHVVVKGETLYGISKKYNLPVQRLKDLNGLVENTIEINQWLKVK